MSALLCYRLFVSVLTLSFLCQGPRAKAVTVNLFTSACLHDRTQALRKCQCFCLCFCNCFASFVNQVIARFVASFITYLAASVITNLSVSVIFTVVGDFIAYSAASVFTIAGIIYFACFACLVTATFIVSLSVTIPPLCHSQFCRTCFYHQTQFDVSVSVSTIVSAVTLKFVLLPFSSPL